MNKTDAELAVLAQCGDRQALASLHDRYAMFVRDEIACLSSNTTDVDDIAQETWMAVCKYIRQLRNPERFRFWLRQVTKSRFYVRKRRCRLTYTSQYPEPSSNELEPIVHATVAERQRKVRQYISGLDSGDCYLLYEHCLHGVSLKCLASMLQVPLGTIKRRMFTARERLARTDIWRLDL